MLVLPCISAPNFKSKNLGQNSFTQESFVTEGMALTR